LHWTAKAGSMPRRTAKKVVALLAWPVCGVSANASLQL
jgi:hypothetical protein